MKLKREDIKTRLELIGHLLEGLTDNRCAILCHEINTIQEMQRLLKVELLKNFDRETKRTVTYKTGMLLPDSMIDQYEEQAFTYLPEYAMSVRQMIDLGLLVKLDVDLEKMKQDSNE